MDFCDGFKVAEAAGLQPPEDGEDGRTQAPEGRHPRAVMRRRRDARCSGKPQTAQLSPECGELRSAELGGSCNLIFHSHR